jgi:glycosyltransferase involved in cell wall biosynthesis
VISIVILSYNHEKYIAETLESVYQLNIPKEVIVIDDCSKDSSLDVIEIL